MCPNCRAFISAQDRVCPYCGVTLGARAAERRSGDAIGGLIPQARFTTTMILLVNTALYVAMMLYSYRSGNTSIADLDGRTLFAFGAKLREAIFQYGQWWRLLTAGFLHGGLIHIAMNSWVLFDLGAQVEEMYGTSRYLFIYFAATVGGFYASCLWSGGLSVGSSAGIFGLIGAMIALGMRHQSALGSAIRGLYVRWAIYGLIFGLLPFFAVDNAAHIGGLAAGFVVGYLADTPRLMTDWRERLWQGLAVLAVLLSAASFGLMFLEFSANARG